MANNRVLVESELLCYIQNNFSKFPKQAIAQTIVGFYTEEEVLTAKTSLFDFVSSLPEKPDGAPRQIRRQNDNRTVNDCDDLMKLFAFLDAAGVTLPIYAAVNLSRLPPVSPGEVDVYSLAVGMETVQQQLKDGVEWFFIFWPNLYIWIVDDASISATKNY